MAASKMKQILLLDPTYEIAFHGPFKQIVTSYLELTNPSDKRVCYKVKTTAPKRYCVRPNSGIVEPAGKVKIAIMLQPLDPDSEAEARTKHKFMVQSTIIESDDKNIPLEEVWQSADQELIMDSKLRCVFHSPQEEEEEKKEEQKEGDGDFVGRVRKDAKPELVEGNVPQNAAPATNTNTTSTFNKPAPIRTSTPISPQLASSAAKENLKSGQSAANRSIASSHNLTSFMQPMSDDYKIVLVSLVMLVLGVILGKFVI